MEKLQNAIVIPLIQSDWFIKPESLHYQKNEDKLESYHQSSEFNNETVTVVGLYTYKDFNGESTDLYVGYNEKFGYLYGFKIFIDETIAAVAQKKANSEYENKQTNDFNKFYDSIKEITPDDSRLKEYKQISISAEKYNGDIGDKGYFYFIPTNYSSGTTLAKNDKRSYGELLEAAKEFIIEGNPYYSEGAGSESLIKYMFTGKSINVASVLIGPTGNIQDMRRVDNGIRIIKIWGTYIKTEFEPIFSVDYICVIFGDYKEKIIEVKDQ